MNNKELENDDLLRHYVNREGIEKAPEGFTAKTMTRIQIEAIIYPGQRSFRVKSFVPAVSVIVTSVLIIAALFLPAGQYEKPLLPVGNYINTFIAGLPEISVAPLDIASIPAWLPYMFIGIILLALFDRALSGFFHREKK